MTRHLVLSLVLGIAGITSGLAEQANAQENIPPGVKKVQSAVVSIIAYDNNGNFIQQGSGFFLDQQGHLVGCLHVLHGAARVEVKTKAGKVYQLTTLDAQDRQADLFSGTADIPASDLADLQIETAMPRVNQSIYVVGASTGAAQSFVQGSVVAAREIPAFGRILEITAPVSATLSGGPMVDEHGKILGVALLPAVQVRNRYFALGSGRLAGLKQERPNANRQWSGGREKNWADTPVGMNYTGMNYIWLEDYTHALAYFQQTIAKHPNAAEVSFNVGYCNLKLSRWQEAADAFNRFIQAHPKQPAAYEQLATALEKLNRWDDAVEAYKQLAAARPNDPWPYIGIATAYSHLGRFEDDMAACKQALQIKSDFYPGFYSIGLAYGRLGKWPEAVEALKQATQLAPAAVEAFDDLGVAYGQTAHWQEAVEAYKHSLALKADDTTAQYNIGVAYGNLGQYQDAAEAYKNEIKISPDDADAMYNLGIAYGKLGRWEDAAELFKKLEAKKPDDPETIDSLGSAYYKLGKYREAIDAHKLALKLKPDSGKFHYNLAIAYLGLKERTAAMEEYRTLKPIDSDLAAKLSALIGK
jgi:tetratricopeptide (TPR) repeat protein